MNIAIISNGRGEDWIALNLINALQQQSQHAIHTFPLVGNGDLFQKQNLTVKLTNPTFPSGGFIRSLTDLIKDIFHGLLNHIFKQIRTIKKETSSSDIIIAVGDVFCLFIASFSNKPIYFLPTAKSDSFMPHSVIERWFIRKTAQKSYPRDLKTTKSFQQYQLPAQFWGNPMMDNLTTTETIIPAKKNQLIIGILPGSREEAYANFAYITSICETLVKQNNNIVFLCAWSPHLNLNNLSLNPHWVTSTNNSLTTLIHSPTNATIIISPNFKAIINQAHLCIGLAGTANEQALYLKKPVICFEGFGPQSTLQRFKEQQQLMGKQLIICPNKSVNTICMTIQQTLASLKTTQPSSHCKNAAPFIISDILNYFPS